MRVLHALPRLCLVESRAENLKIVLGPSPLLWFVPIRVPLVR